MHKAAGFAVTDGSATSRVVSVAERVIVPPVKAYRDTKYPARFLHVHRQTVCRTTKSGGDLVGNQQDTFAIAILRIRFNHSGWYMRIPPAP